MDLLNRIRRAWVRYIEHERVRNELALSTDRQLADMGIARGDIGRIALEHARQRAAALVPARHAAPGRTHGQQAAPAPARLRFRHAAGR